MRHTRRHWRRIILLAVPTLLVAAFIASVAVVAAAEQATVTVQMQDNMFAPQSVTVNVGDTVTWTHAGQNPHDATANNGAFSSPRRMMNGQTFSWTATAAGTYEYVCTIHAGRGMTGTIVVQGGTGGPAAVPRTGGGGMADPAGAMLRWTALGLLVVGVGAIAGLLAGRRRREA